MQNSKLVTKKQSPFSRSILIHMTSLTVSFQSSWTGETMMDMITLVQSEIKKHVDLATLWPSPRLPRQDSSLKLVKTSHKFHLRCFWTVTILMRVVRADGLISIPTLLSMPTLSPRNVPHTRELPICPPVESTLNANHLPESRTLMM